MSSYSIYDVFETMRERPALYVGNLSVLQLRAFIDGYVFAMYEAGIEEDSSPNFRDFHQFVSKELGFGESTAGWANCIMATAIGLDPKTIKWEGYDRNVSKEQLKVGMELFYSLLDKFKEENA